MSTTVLSAATLESASQPLEVRQDRARAVGDYPLSQVFLKPLSAHVAALLVPSSVRPVQITILGAAFVAIAALCVGFSLGPTSVAAMLVLAGWFCDRLDGELARQQGTVSAWGAWLDANLDELGDLAIHTAIAAAAAAQWNASWPWGLFIAFVAGKYLFMYGLSMESSLTNEQRRATSTTTSKPRSLVSQLYHLPGNADVRAHVLMLALAWHALAFELAWVAMYYNLRWIVRYVLVARRLREVAR